MKSDLLLGFRYLIRGRVQGVGFRDFVQRNAYQREISGYVRNLTDGSVLVCAIGFREQLAELEQVIREGPVGSEVRSVSVEEMEDRTFEDFRIVA